jgi:D,D-heptose 1,7-bisphosphate phosphatase
MLEPTCPLIHGSLPAPAGSAAVFLDRDGVIFRDTGYPDDPDSLEVLPGVPEALRALREAGWILVVVSNQSGVARGKFGLDRLAEIHDRLVELLAEQEAALDAIYYCPHHPEGIDPFRLDCDHRKPEAGMLRSAASALDIDLSASWMVGDKESDVEAAHRAGCRAIRIGKGDTTAEARAADLLEAANYILKNSQV